jgi:SET domain-containing protein
VDIKTSHIHGTGLFARVSIPPGQRLIEYVGRKIGKEESLVLCRNENAYIFSLTDEMDLDGNVDWNPARFINHSCSPNCEAEQDDDDRVWIHSRRAISPGEELTYNYGYDLIDYRDHPCRCGAPDCLGFMVAEELFPVVKHGIQDP